MGNKTIHSDQSINQTVVTFALLYCSCTSKVNADILWCVVSWDTPYTSSSSVSASIHSPTVSSRFFLLGGSFSRRPPILKNYHYSFYWHFSKLFIIKMKEIFPNLKSNVNKYCMFLFCKKMILKIKERRFFLFSEKAKLKRSMVADPENCSDISKFYYNNEYINV